MSNCQHIENNLPYQLEMRNIAGRINLNLALNCSLFSCMQANSLSIANIPGYSWLGSCYTQGIQNTHHMQKVQLKSTLERAKYDVHDNHL